MNYNNCNKIRYNNSLLENKYLRKVNTNGLLIF
jgi:hypothetical protein